MFITKSGAIYDSGCIATDLPVTYLKFFFDACIRIHSLDVHPQSITEAAGEIMRALDSSRNSSGEDGESELDISATAQGILQKHLAVAANPDAVLHWLPAKPNIGSKNADFFLDVEDKNLVNSVVPSFFVRVGVLRSDNHLKSKEYAANVCKGFKHARKNCVILGLEWYEEKPNCALGYLRAFFPYRAWKNDLKFRTIGDVLIWTGRITEQSLAGILKLVMEVAEHNHSAFVGSSKGKNNASIRNNNNNNNSSSSSHYYRWMSNMNVVLVTSAEGGETINKVCDYREDEGHWPSPRPNFLFIKGCKPVLEADRLTILSYPFLVRITADVSKDHFKALCKQLAAVHGEGYVHGDVRFSNILFPAVPADSCLIDFGICKQAGGRYVAGILPIQDGKRHPDVREEGKMSFEHDTYSLAAVITYHVRSHLWRQRTFPMWEKLAARIEGLPMMTTSFLSDPCWDAIDTCVSNPWAGIRNPAVFNGGLDDDVDKDRNGDDGGEDDEDEVQAGGYEDAGEDDDDGDGGYERSAKRAKRQYDGEDY